MATGSFRVKSGSLNIKSGTSGSESGDVTVNANKAEFHNGSTSSAIVTEAHSATLTNKSIDSDNNTLTNIVNANIKAGAAIAYSKLTLTGSVVNADINASAAIAYSKLNLGTSIVNADINASAAIAYSKLSLASSIVNADIGASAAIAYSKLNLATSIVNADISTSAAIAYSKLNLTTSIVNGDIGASAAIAYSKLNLSSSIVNADIAAGAAIAISKISTGLSGSLVGTTDTQTLSAKTFSDAVTLAQISTPSTPSSGFNKIYAKSDGYLYTVDPAGAERKIGAANGNYISNPDAEGSTTGWATYSDGAQNIPVDGTGGTATSLTFSRSTSSPLRGTASFSMVQTNSTSLQGKGVSYDFTIDSADKAKVLKTSFDFNASSTFVTSDGRTAPLNDGTSSTNAGNSDIEVFMYDVTNSVLIPVSPQVITANGTNNFTFNGEFQTASNSTSYRLILHIATASANATGWTFKFDNVFVGASPALYGPPVTDWNTNLSVTLAGVGTATATTYESRRDGDSLQVVGHFTTGTVAASTFSITLPAGLSIDSNKLPASGTKVGDIVQLTSASNAIYPTETMFLFYDGSDTAKIYAATNVASSTYTKANGNSLFGSTTQVDFSFRVPIAGWSSTLTMSNDTDTRIVSASIALAVDYAVSANAVIKFDTVLFDSHTAYSTSTGLYTVPVSGRYRVSATISTTSTAAGIYIAVNGTGKVYLVTPANSPEGGSQTVTCVAGDTIGVFSDSTKTIDGTSTPYFSAISIERLTGPAAIAASESVNMRYYSSSSSVSGSLGTVTYATKDYDSHNQYSSGVYTIPTAGKYQINVGLLITGSIALNNNVIVEIQKNSTVVSRFTEFFPATLTDGKVAFSDQISCLAGDTIRIQASSSVTGPSIVSSNFDNYVSLCRTGN